MAGLNEQTLLEMYRRMKRIRLFEDTAIQCYPDGEIPGGLHASQGQEGEIVGACFEACSIASEICALVASDAFWDLKGPVQRVATMNTHIPFSPSLESQLHPTAEKIVNALRKNLA